MTPRSHKDFLVEGWGAHKIAAASAASAATFGRPRSPFNKEQLHIINIQLPESIDMSNGELACRLYTLHGIYACNQRGL